VRPGWKVWRVLGNLLGVREMEYLDSRTVRDELRAALPEMDFGNDIDLRVAHAEVPPAVEGLVRMQVRGLYATDPRVRRAGPLQASPEGCRLDTVRLNPQDAGRLADGQRVRLRQDGCETELTLVLDASVPSGVALTVAGSAALGELGPGGGIVTLASA
jgi:NADH-quinone oxidoreductase subunit G